MPSRDLLDQIRHLIRPVANRIANSIARAVVQTIDNSKQRQLLQLGVLEGEDIDEAESFQPYGFFSVPLAGAEAVVVFPNGDRGHPLVVAVDDRRYRPTDSEPGEAGLYNSVAGTVVRLTVDGDIVITPAPGREVFIRSEGGTVDRRGKKSEHDGHTHGPGLYTTPSGGNVTGTSGGAAAVTGTTKLRVE